MKKHPIQKAFEDERSSALLYETMAAIEPDPRLAEVYRRISATELEHAIKWTRRAEQANLWIPEYKPSWRIRTLVSLGRRFGPGMILPSIHNMERTGAADYAQMTGTANMHAQEESHSRLLNLISGSVRGGLEGGLVAQLEGRHRSAGGNALRAAVLGANDGLVSNLSLVMGVAGVSMEGKAVLIAGLAGLLAGSISMALGEWLSVQSSRELYANQIETEREEIETAPEEEAGELALIYEARGLPAKSARALADQILANKDSALDTLAREELGIDPTELGGSAWVAALTSFVLFAIGAILPVAPFLFTNGLPAILISIALSTGGLFALGAAITLYTGRSVLFSGTRMVIFGLVAAAVTFGIGSLIGLLIAEDPLPYPISQRYVDGIEMISTRILSMFP